MMINSNFATIGKLIANRGGAQIIVFLSTLYIARYFTPHDFGKVGLFTSVCSFVAMGSGLRFEVRALVAKTSRARELLIGMAYLSNFYFFVAGLGITGIIACVNAEYAWLLLVPAGIMLSSIVQFVIPAQSTDLARVGRLGLMTQMVALTTASLQIISATMYPTATSLMISRLLGWSVGAAFMMALIKSGYSHARKCSRYARRLLRSSAHEIAYGVPASVISVLTLQVPVYVFSAYGMTAATGLYWIAFNILFVPYIVVTGSLRPLYLKHVASTIRPSAAYAHLKKHTYFALILGSVVSVVISGTFLALAPIILGSSWSNAGPFTLALAPLLASLIAQTPISFSISAYSLQRLNFIGGVVQVVLRAVAMLTLIAIERSALEVLWGFSIVSAATYAIYIYAALRTVRDRAHQKSNADNKER